MTEDTSEQNSLAQRARRYVDVSSSVARVGVQAALSKISSTDRTAQNAALLRQVLGKLKGPLMKVGQLVATVPDLLPPDYAQELLALQADAPSMGWPFVRRRMAGELGPDWQSKFSSFDKEACAAASLGQVHKARALDGRELACKLQYPAMASVIEADLAQLKMLFGLFDQFDGAIHASEAPFQEIALRLREELDYHREAVSMAMYGEMLAAVPCAHVPRPVAELSTNRLLCMDWMEGERFIDAAATRSQEERNQIAINMFLIWYTPFYNYAILHGDPHLGNYTVRADGSINLLDYGCIRVFRPELIKAVILLFQALREDNREQAFEAFRLWGFQGLTQELFDVLIPWAKFIYAPVLHDSTRPIEESNSTAQGRAIAKKVHEELHKIGGVSVPPEFILIDRASVGLGSVFLRLKAEVNWFALFTQMTKDFDLEALKKRQGALLARYGWKAYEETSPFNAART